MVLNEELKFGSKEWIVFTCLVLFVTANTTLSMTDNESVSVLKSLYVLLLAWISYPIIALTVASHVLRDDTLSSVDMTQRSRKQWIGYLPNILFVWLSVILTIAVPVLVSRCTTIHPLLQLILYLESIRFSIKTLLFGSKKWTGSGGQNFERYVLSFMPLCSQ